MITRASKKLLAAILAILGAYLLFLGAGFFGVKYGLTNASSGVDEKSEEFNKEMANVEAIREVSQEEIDAEKVKEIEKKLENKIFCKINEIGKLAPVNAEKIISTFAKTQDKVIALKMILAAKLRLEKNEVFISNITQCDSGDKPVVLYEDIINKFQNSQAKNIFPWMNDTHWATIKEAVLKDKENIIKASEMAEIEPRLLVSALIVEQARLFHAQRELFEKFFAPLKILGNATKISLGVMGIKEATAIQIEQHLKDEDSPYYLGKKFENMLIFKTKDTASERFSRLTNDKDHFYSYLYGALYLKQMLSQWEKAGYKIKYRPEIAGTLFNVGFPQSKPKADAKVGGSTINVGEGKYSFGSLAYEFYYSGELDDDFSYITN